MLHAYCTALSEKAESLASKNSQSCETMVFSRPVIYHKEGEGGERTCLSVYRVSTRSTGQGLWFHPCSCVDRKVKLASSGDKGLRHAEWHQNQELIN